MEYSNLTKLNPLHNPLFNIDNNDNPLLNLQRPPLHLQHYPNDLINGSGWANASPAPWRPACLAGAEVGADCNPGDGGGSGAVLIALVVVTVLLALGGFLGNGLTVLAILSSGLRSNVNGILIGNLSLACVLYCCLVLPLQALAFYHRAWILPHEVCVASAAVRTWLIGVNMSLLSAIALYRFIHVVHPQAYNQWSEGRFFFPVVAVCWMFACVFCVTPVLGWGSYRFEPRVLQCTFDSQAVDKSHKVTVITIGYLIPCIFISVCYARIGCVVYRSRTRALRSSVHGRKKSQRGSLRLTAMMLLIFLGFFVGTTPYFLVNIADPRQSRPMAHMWAPGAAWLLYCLNPVIYTLMDSNFQQAYRQLVCCLLCRQDAARLQRESFRSKASIKPPSPSANRE